ncbi:hypothetical protein MASR1M32_26190 [Rhodobacter sp.]
MNDEFGMIYTLQASSVLITSGLLVVILRKAGFSWLWSMLGLAEIAGALLNMGLLSYGLVSFTTTLGLSLIIGVLPLLLLAFGNWPRLAARYSPSETFK